MLGALAHYVTHAAPGDFQPMKANFGILPELAVVVKDKRQRYLTYVERGLAALEQALADVAFTAADPERALMKGVHG